MKSASRSGFLVLALLACLSASAAAQSTKAPVAIAPGVLFVEVPASGTRPKLWVYMPSPLPATPVPAVFIAPAGTSCLTGNSLGKGSQPEHLPYVKAGFAVVAYELSGAVSDSPTVDEMNAAFQKFGAANGGVSDLSAAMDYAEGIKAIDKTKFIVAGHSSAGTVALLGAAMEPRVKACIAYAPVTMLGAQIPGLEQLDAQVPGAKTFAYKTSPDRFASKITAPLFLFSSEDDDMVAHVRLEDFHKDVKESNLAVTREVVSKGGHYKSMINDGIPLAVKWLQSLKL